MAAKIEALGCSTIPTAPLVGIGGAYMN